MRIHLSVVLAMAFGLIVLLGYFIPIGPLGVLRTLMVEWAGILVVVALLVGVVNLYQVHWQKMTTDSPSRIYSIVLIVSLSLTLLVVGWFGPVHGVSLWLFNYIQVPIESSLMALLTIILVIAVIRMFRRRINFLSILFVITVFFILIASSPMVEVQVPALTTLQTWVTQVPAVAGARGILIGITLGILATGLRILIGSDRPYEG
jgi:hypothetical protein